MKSKVARKYFIDKYGKECWLLKPLSNTNKLTYHHISKKCNGGKITLENGSILSEEGHRQLHALEIIDIELYNKINRLLTLYKHSGYKEILIECRRLLSNGLEEKGKRLGR